MTNNKLVLFIFLQSIFLIGQAQGQTDTLSAPIVEDSISRVPAIGLSLPEPYRKGYFGVVGSGLFLQQRTRITGHFFDPDGNASFTVGLGNPEKYLGVEARVNIYGLHNKRGAPNNLGEGSFDIHLSRHLGHDFWIGGGIFDLFGWKPEPPNKLTSYYVAATKSIKLRRQGTFGKTLYLTAGAGNGKFRQDEDYSIFTENPWNYYGGFALQVLPEGNFIAEWNGFNAFSGVSFLPIKKWPLQVLVGIDDIFHKNKKLIVSATMSFYLAKKSNRTKFSNYSLVPITPPQTSRVL